MNSIQMDERILMDSNDAGWQFCYYPTGDAMWELFHLARGDIIAGQAPEWEALSEQSTQHCRYCGRPAHKCGCGGAE